MSETLSRRELLRRAGLVGTAAVIPVAVTESTTTADREAQGPAQPVREAFETLTAAESDTLEAIAARLIPSDASGPGAAEARAAHYIDRALGGAHASSRAAYTSGLAAVNAYAQTSKGAPFARLSPADQDAVLTDMERGIATGFAAPGSAPGAAAFFNLVRSHTIEGTFTDPYYGGNARFVGWDLIRYPGVRLSVSAADQQLRTVAPNHQSAYDFVMFSKSKPSAAVDVPHEDHDRGD